MRNWSFKFIGRVQDEYLLELKQNDNERDIKNVVETNDFFQYIDDGDI